MAARLAPAPAPQTIPQMCARLVWVPGYLFRSELLVHNFSQPKLFSFCWLGLPFFSRERHYHTFRLTTYNCIVLTDFQHTKFFPFQSLGFIIKIFLKYSKNFADFSLDIHVKFSYYLIPAFSDKVC